MPAGSGPADLAHQHLHDLAGIAWISPRLGPLDRVCRAGNALCCLKLGDFLRYDNAAATVTGVSVSSGSPIWQARVPRSWQYAGQRIEPVDFAASPAGVLIVARGRAGWTAESTLADAGYVFPINPGTGRIENPIPPGDPRLAGAQPMRVAWNVAQGAGRATDTLLDNGGQWEISGNGEVVAADRARRTVIWRLSRVGEGKPERIWAPGGPHVYFEDDAGTLCAVDLRQAGARSAAGRRWWRDGAPSSAPAAPGLPARVPTAPPAAAAPPPAAAPPAPAAAAPVTPPDGVAKILAQVEALMQAKRYARALAACDEAPKVEAYQRDPRLAVAKGRIYEAMRRPVDAIAQYQLALRWDPEYREAREALERAEEAMKKARGGKP